MSEPKVYEAEIDRVFATGGDTHITSDSLKTGQMLEVNHIAGSFENIATSEYVELGKWNGHAYIPLYKGAPAVIGDFVFWDGSIFLREGQCIYAKLADVANGEKMKLRADGIWVKW
jgi:hypothetical protein